MTSVNVEHKSPNPPWTQRFPRHILRERSSLPTTKEVYALDLRERRLLDHEHGEETCTRNQRLTTHQIHEMVPRDSFEITYAQTIYAIQLNSAFQT